MALTKCFVILFVVYATFGISPLDAAAIPDRLDSPDSNNENDYNSELYTTTGATEEDIEKIFETYENLYIKNANWFNDEELTKNANTITFPVAQPEEETTLRDLETTEPTADDVVESIHHIMDDKIDAKSNRTDRTIVVVVTTNVFNVNGSDESSKRQHTLLSFGTPGMIQKETSTDPTLSMHNKITTAFFNSSPSEIVEQPETLNTNDNEKSAAEGSKAIVFDDSVGDSENTPHVTEADHVPDIGATEQPKDEGGDEETKIDIRRLDESNTKSEGRSFEDELPNEDSNDILRIMKIIPNRIADELSTGSLSKPFELPPQEPQDSSLMEAIDNILDTDVRKAFERDIPQTHHVPFDISIEEEALYAPLKDLNEYIVEVSINANYEGTVDKVENVDEISRKLVENVGQIEFVGKSEKSSDQSNYNQEGDNLTDGPAVEIEQKTTTITTDAPTVASITEEATPTAKITDDKETKTTATEAAILKETTTAVREDEEATKTDEPASHTTTAQIDNINKKEESITASASAYDTFEAPTTGNIIDAQDETLRKSQPLEEYVLSELDAEESIAESESDVHANVPETAHISSPDGESTPTAAAPEDTLVRESSLFVEAESQLQNTPDGGSKPVIGTFGKRVDESFDEYPIYVQIDTTTEYVTNPNLYIGALFSAEQVAAILEEAERVRTVSNVQILSSTTDNIDFSTEENSVSIPSSFIYSSIPSQGEVSNSEDKLDDADDKSDEADDKSNKAEDKSDESDDKSEDDEETVGQKDEAKVKEFEDLKSEAIALLNRAKDVVDKSVTLVKMYKTTIDSLLSTTTKPHGEDVVSEVVKVDEETTEQHQIIKKPGVDDAGNGTTVDSKTINVKSVESNHLVGSEPTDFRGRSLGDDDVPVDPLRTLVEAVELTADITKTVDNFQSFVDPNDPFHLASNQVIENPYDMALARRTEELRVEEASLWYAAATYLYLAAAIFMVGLILLLSLFSVRYRQIKRNISFSY